MKIQRILSVALLIICSDNSKLGTFAKPSTALKAASEMTQKAVSGAKKAVEVASAKVMSTA